MQKDKVARIGLMVARLGTVLALALGIPRLFGWVWSQSVADSHMLGGIMVFGGIWLATIRYALAKRAGGLLYAAAALVTLGAGLGIFMATGGAFNGLIHFVIMFLAVGLGEAGSAKAARA